MEVTLAQTLSLEQAIHVRDSWTDGRLETSFDSWIRITPQLTNPTPPVVADPRFRRALLMAIDREAMAQNLCFGLSQVAHSYVSPSQPEYKDVETAVVRYPYDPQRGRAAERGGLSPRPGRQLQ